MDETLNDLLALLTTLVERIERLEETKTEQDSINTLLTDQIVALDDAARYARDEIAHRRSQFRPRVGGVDFCNDKLAAAVARIG